MRTTTQFTHVSMFVDSFRNSELILIRWLRSGYDVAICSFPGRQCFVLSQLGMRVIYHFSHRYLHHTSAKGRDAEVPDWTRLYIDHLHQVSRRGSVRGKRRSSVASLVSLGTETIK
eukprot:8809049-Pyramimonas_sp.AAC.1